MNKIVPFSSLAILLFISVAFAVDKDEFPLSDQLKLLRKIEYPDIQSGIGPLVIEVDEMKFEVCLSALQEKVRKGYIPNYSGEFDNSFLNDLMIGTIGLDGITQRSNHAHRLIKFELKKPDQIIKPPVESNNPQKSISKPYGALTDEESVVYLYCQATLTPNHKFLGVNFIQKFQNLVFTERIMCFVLINNKGEVLWQQKRNKGEANGFEKKYFREDFGSVTDQPMDGKIRISNRGDVFAFHAISSMRADMSAPTHACLYNSQGNAIKLLPQKVIPDFAEFCWDGSRLLLCRETPVERNYSLYSINPNTGMNLWQFVSDGWIDYINSISQSNDGKSVVFLKSDQTGKEKKIIVLNTRGEIIGQKDQDYGFRFPSSIQMMPDGKSIYLSSSIYDTSFKICSSLKLKNPINMNEFSVALVPLAIDPYTQVICRTAPSWVNGGKENEISGRALMVIDSENIPLAKIVAERSFSRAGQIIMFLEEGSIFIDSKGSHIYLATNTEFMEFQFISFQRVAK